MPFDKALAVEQQNAGLFPGVDDLYDGCLSLLFSRLILAWRAEVTDVSLRVPESLIFRDSSDERFTGTVAPLTVLVVLVPQIHRVSPAHEFLRGLDIVNCKSGRRVNKIDVAFAEIDGILDLFKKRIGRRGWLSLETVKGTSPGTRSSLLPILSSSTWMWYLKLL